MYFTNYSTPTPNYLFYVFAAQLFIVYSIFKKLVWISCVFDSLVKEIYLTNSITQ